MFGAASPAGRSGDPDKDAGRSTVLVGHRLMAD